VTTESAVRLLRRDWIEQFETRMGELKGRFQESVERLGAVYGELLGEARNALGELYEHADYPARLSGEFSDFHLATHGVLDPDRPDQSYLVLAGADEDSQRLALREIAGLNFQPNGLVVHLDQRHLDQFVPQTEAVVAGHEPFVPETRSQFLPVQQGCYK
jgi:alkanesulfonate monooxygenase SsuD/methylene tetrahydromethanopterin reductase-like flavin-dependent oxidoreductase (luciferase family)